jgi:hypothetical protein
MHQAKVAYVDSEGNRRRQSFSRGGTGGTGGPDLDDYVKKKQAARDRAAAIKVILPLPKFLYELCSQNLILHNYVIIANMM